MNKFKKIVIKKNEFTRLLLLIMGNLIAVFGANAATINVASVPELQIAIDNANAGDILVLANGTYLNNTLNINTSNITIQPATPGGVFLNGTDDININGDYITFTGFQFTSGDIGALYIIEVFGSHNVLSQLNFSGYYAKKYIEIKGGTQYNEVSYCNIEKKPAAAETGCTLQVLTSPTVPGYHRIRYCSFQNYYGIGGDNGNEPLRVGIGIEQLNVSRTIMEYCYFNNTGLGDAESISIKCRENTIRFCTFTNQQNAMLSFRNGDNNVAYSNFFINAGGIRVKEANNIYCYNNYFENAGVGSTADAVSYIFVSPNLNNINFLNNTFVNCGFIDLGNTGATNNTWANNIFLKSSGKIFKNINTGTTWAGNMFQGTLGITIPSGMANVNPLLITNSDGYQGLSSLSPAINAGSASYAAILDIPNIDDDPNLMFDISGQSRPATAAQKDVGCDEFTTGPTTNHPLVVTEVGPFYLGGPLLPIRLISFGVITQNGKAAISWTTGFEQNSSHFEIQRSFNGINFTTAGKVNAAGNSTTALKYSFTDLGTLLGMNYYRLKQIDLDGSVYYSEIKQINITPVNPIVVYPNPATNAINIQFPEHGCNKVDITVYNLKGQVVKRYMHFNNQNAINNIITCNCTDLENGVYFVGIRSGNYSNTIKLIVRK